MSSYDLYLAYHYVDIQSEGILVLTLVSEPYQAEMVKLNWTLVSLLLWRLPCLMALPSASLLSSFLPGAWYIQV